MVAVNRPGNCAILAVTGGPAGASVPVALIRDGQVLAATLRLRDHLAA